MNITIVNADPYEEPDLFDEQINKRTEELKNIIINSTAIKIAFNNSYDIISPSINGEYKRVTRIVNNKIMGHKDFTFKDLNDIIENYLFDGDISEIIY